MLTGAAVAGVGLTLAVGWLLWPQSAPEEPRVVEPALAEASAGAAGEASAAEASSEGSVAEASAPAPELIVHTVADNESLWLIGNRYNCPYTRIMEANGLTRETIQPGQQLTIPDCTPRTQPTAVAPVAADGETMHVIEPGDFLETIAVRYQCSVGEIMAANNLESDSIYAGDTLRIPTCSAPPPPSAEAPAADDGRYVIAPGDTLGAIAAAHGCSVGELQVANQLSADMIRAGDRLTIPACTGEPVQPRETSVERAPAVRSGGDLAGLMRERGFRAPRNFKASVVVIDFNAARTTITRQRSFDYGGTGDDAAGWNPASSIKLFSAVAAAERANDLGFSLSARVTFHGRRQQHTFTLRDLIADALGPSDNIAHNFLVQFVGFDELNGRFFSSRNGFERSAILRAYETSRWMNLGEAASFRSSPRITIEEGGRTREIDPRNGDYQPACGGAACTSVEDLGECMRRLMLHEQLPEREQFDLDAETLRFIRTTLRSERSRGEEVVDRLAAAFDDPGARFYHKAGFAGDWYSDNVYVYVPGRPHAYIVTLAAHPGRSSLNSAATIIGELLAAGEL